MAMKADHFVWRYHELIIVVILLKGSYQRSEESRRAEIAFLFLSPAIFNSFSILLYFKPKVKLLSAFYDLHPSM